MSARLAPAGAIRPRGTVARLPLAALVVLLVLGGCGVGAASPPPAATPTLAAGGGGPASGGTGTASPDRPAGSRGPGATAASPSGSADPGHPSSSPLASGSSGASPSPGTTSFPRPTSSDAATPRGSASPAPAISSAPARPPGSTATVDHDPRKFAFAAKGLTGEMMAFVTISQIDYAIETMDWDVVSTVAYFSLEATADGTIARDAGWKAWNSSRMDELIDTAHANGSKVVISLERFAWSPGQTAVARELLASRERRDRLARETAAEVARRGVDGVNVDFEPIPDGQKEEFTDFVRTLRQELDAIAPGMQLTFCVVGHHETYDVAAATGPDAADAVYLMGYHYAGTWSSRAGSTAPMGGDGYDIIETVESLLLHVERNEIIVGVPYYGHVWPTVSNRLNAATRGGGYDVPVERAFAIAEQHGYRYDKVEQVAWVAYRASPCDGCAPGWYQLYFDDARASGAKWNWIKRNGLLGTGVWTIGFEGRPGPLNEMMRGVMLQP